MPLLSYTISAYTPFTKILSANVNQDKTDIKNRFNWSGTAGDASTGLDGANIQSYTAVAETKASLTTQGVTLTATTGQGANGNNITIAFTSGGTAGSEVVTVSSAGAISVQIASGTSTVTQVVTAINNSVPAQYWVVASGTSSSTVSTASALNLSGGVTGGGLTRSTKLALDYANWIVINNSSGQMSSTPYIGYAQGGTGLQIVPGNQNAGDVFQVNSSKTGMTLGAPTAVPASLRLYQFYNFY